MREDPDWGSNFRFGVYDMEGSGLFQPVLHCVGHTAAFGAAGVDFLHRRIVQLPQGGEKSGGQGGYICFPAVGQRGAAVLQGQLLLEA